MGYIFKLSPYSVRYTKDVVLCRNMPEGYAP
jgi:hypothetical protein